MRNKTTVAFTLDVELFNTFRKLTNDRGLIRSHLMGKLIEKWVEENK